jgi:hypothetical protein
MQQFIKSCKGYPVVVNGFRPNIDCEDTSRTLNSIAVCRESCLIPSDLRSLCRFDALIYIRVWRTAAEEVDSLGLASHCDKLHIFMVQGYKGAGYSCMYAAASSSSMPAGCLVWCSRLGGGVSMLGICCFTSEVVGIVGVKVLGMTGVISGVCEHE